MTPKLRTMLVTVGVFILGGVGFVLSTPQPATRTMAELRDAGIADGQKFVIICPEHFDARTRNRVNRLQPGVMRPRQRYGRIARVAVCFNPDGGNCFRPSDGRINVSDMEGEVIVPSLRADLVGTVDDAGVDDAGEDNTVDDAQQYRSDSCAFLTCPQADTAEDAGTFVNPYSARFCGALNRLALQPAPNMMPDCRDGDGGWDDNAGEPGHIAAPNCKATGPFGLPDGGPRWAGCNSFPREYMQGPACLPVEASVVAGDILEMEWVGQ